MMPPVNNTSGIIFCWICNYKSHQLVVIFFDLVNKRL